MSAPRHVAGIENRRRVRADGSVHWSFRVRWTDPLSGRRRSEEYDDQRDAIDRRAQLRLALRGGRLAQLTAGRERLAAFVEHEWWPTYAAVELERSTLRTYASVWNRHALPRLGALELRQVDAAVAARFRRDLEHDGLGAATVAKTMTMLQSVFARAVVWGRVSANPFAAVRKPPAPAAAVQALPPALVERIAAALEPGGERLLALLIAYAGLRPEEALALGWRHVRAATLLVERKNVDGRLLGWQKVSGKPPRTVELLAPLADDLAAARAARGDVDDDALVIARPDGGAWREHDYRNWRRRRFQPAAAAAGAPQPGRPYVLRHSFASLLLHEGRLSPAEIAEQLGHSLQTLFKHYAHVIAELKGQPRLAAAEQIERARRERPHETPRRTK